MRNEKIVIGYISPNSPDDRKASSGTLYTIINALKSINDVEILWIPISYDNIWGKLNRYKKAFERITHISLPFSFAKLHATSVKNTIDKKIVEQCDILFCAFQSFSLFNFQTNKPIIYLSDTTYAALANYYVKEKNIHELKARNFIEQSALDKASSIILSSQWAADSANRDYKQHPEKIHIIEFGANIDDKSIIPHEFIYEGHLDILFLGVDWKRKGGKIAVDACQWLNENGIPSTLHIVGIDVIDDEIAKLPFINHVGFLNKNNPTQYEQLVAIIKKCHCLLLPTIAECAGIAFCEASANGLPSFSHKTGGIPNYIINNVNGILLPIGSNGADFGRKIKECLESGGLEKMSLSAKDLYISKLNWSTWAKKVEKIIRNYFTENKKGE